VANLYWAVLVLLAGLQGLPRSVEAAALPSALIESVSGGISGAELLDYVSPGQVIQLGASGSLILAYLETCVRETITGGEVTIGMHASQVRGGEIKREFPPCSTANVSDWRALNSAGTVFRSGPLDKRLAKPKRSAIYSLSPIFEIADHGIMLLKRIDQPGEQYEVVVSPSSLIRGRFYDFAAGNARLKAGGRYEVSLGVNRLVFEVDETANAEGPLLARLVRLTSSKITRGR
jgi:hypothetical protein